VNSATPAERMLIDLGISEPKEIDLDAIAWTRGAIVNYRPIDNCEATIVGSKRRAVISVNSRSMPERRRFSLAHELGHWHHHRGRILFCGKNDVCNFANDALNPERQADSFASDLILPGFMIEPRLRKMKRPTLAAARELAEKFHASLTATLVKMTILNHFPMIIVCHNKTDRRWFERPILSSLGGFPRGLWIRRPLQRTCCSTERPSNVSRARWAQTRGSISKVAIASRSKNSHSSFQTTRF
jgi:Zn-dependent peptidase ImmA (M78 family)